MKRCDHCGQIVMDEAYFKELEGEPLLHFLRVYEAYKKSQNEKTNSEVLTNAKTRIRNVRGSAGSADATYYSK